MNKYEQLQEFLNKCIELWWNYSYLRNHLECDKEWLLNEGLIPLISYHELFSKDSGLMEAVEWKYDYYSWFDNEKVIISNHNNTYELCEKSSDEQYHYIMMAYLTSEEKIDYFLENALLPTKQD